MYNGPVRGPSVALFACLVACEAARPNRRDVPAPTADAGPARRRRITEPAPTIPIPTSPDVPCQRDADCRGGLCLTPSIDAQYSRVFRDCVNGRAWRAQHRLYTCVLPACTSDEACPRGMRCGEAAMLPFPQRACVPAQCSSAWDCRAHARGQCLPFVAAAHCEPGGWACSYESDECAPRDVDRRCPARPGVITRCVPVNGRYRCVAEGAPLP